jgi:hypothetical protein
MSFLHSKNRVEHKIEIDFCLNFPFHNYLHSGNHQGCDEVTLLTVQQIHPLVPCQNNLSNHVKIKVSDGIGRFSSSRQWYTMMESLKAWHKYVNIEFPVNLFLLFNYPFNLSQRKM